jgi:hypothetical protein
MKPANWHDTLVMLAVFLVVVGWLVLGMETNRRG